MNCINNAMALFQGQNQCAAITVAVAAFVLGMIAMCILCKLFCPCGKKSCKKDGKKPQQKQPQQKKGEEKPFEKRKPHPAPADGSVEIYVGNLSYDMTEDQLREAFAAYGKVNSARLITNKFNGKSKGFGFVQMPDRAEADKAIEALNEKEIMGRQMKCNVAKNLI